jgi:AcrR family transcriptional regulator
VPAVRKRQGAALEANRRAALLRAAARLFVEKGFAATTTRDIAEAVGMRSGSPFYHFRSKQELLKAAMIEGLETGYRRLQAASAGIVDPEQRLRVMIRTHLGNLLEGDCQAPMLLYESRSLDARPGPKSLPSAIATSCRGRRRWTSWRPAAGCAVRPGHCGCSFSACSTGAANGTGQVGNCRSTRSPKPPPTSYWAEAAVVGQASGRAGSLHHSLHDPAYSRAPWSPAISIANRL